MTCIEPHPCNVAILYAVVDNTTLQFSKGNNLDDLLGQIRKHPLITFTYPCAGILKPSNAQGFYSSNAQE